MLRNLLFILLFGYSLNVFAQKESNTWFFSCGQGLTFNSGRPAPRNTPSVNDTWRSGGSTMSTPNGRLLFSVAWQAINDSLNQPMPHGKLKSDYRTIQSSLIVPWPDSTHLYFVFTPGGTNKDSLRYTIVNLKLRGGLGDVDTNRKDLCLPTISSGKVTSARHANRHDYWVLSPHGNSDTIHAYLITSKGLFLSPIKSGTGIYFEGGSNFATDNTYGYFKLSPSGKKVCNLNGRNSSMLADFDIVSGKVSNVWDFMCYDPALEFSPKGKYMYVIYNSKLCQYDVSLSSKTGFLNSKKIIDSLQTYNIGSCFQSASDGKIYIYNNNSTNSNFLNVIHAPDSSDKNARFEKNYYMFTTSNSLSSGHNGLPNFVQSLFYRPHFNIRHNCARDSVFFSIADDYNLDSVHWEFGEPGSGVLNYSNRTTNVFHSYKKPGNYTVRMISYYDKYSDTITETFYLMPNKPFLGNDKTICATDNYILANQQGLFKTYKWSTGHTTPSIFANKAGIYHLTVTAFDGCKSSDTIEIKKLTVIANFNVSDSDQCFRNHLFTFSDVSTSSSGKLQPFWSFSDSSFYTDSSFEKTFKTIGNYTVRLKVIGDFGCTDTMVKQIQVNKQTPVSFSINKSIQCLNDQRFDFKITTQDSAKLNYIWDLGDYSITSPTDIIDKRYKRDSTYEVSLISITEQNCYDTAKQMVQVLGAPNADFSWTGFCSNNPINFSFGGSLPSSPINTNFKWRFPDGDSSSVINPSKLISQAGFNKVSLTLQSDNGCFSEKTHDVEILLQAKANFEVEDVCEDSLAKFINTTQNGYWFQWKLGDGTTTNVNSPKHKYQINKVTKTYNVTLVAKVPGGCSDSLTKAVTINANPSSDFTYLLGGRQVSFTASEPGATKYEWTFGDGETTTTTVSKTTYHYLKYPSGNYTACLKVTNSSDCFTETCKDIAISGAASSLNKPISLKIYPNPNSGKFTLEYENLDSEISLEIFNNLGQLVHHTNLHQNKTQFDLALRNGIYLIKIKSNNNSSFQRMVVGQ